MCTTRWILLFFWCFALIGSAHEVRIWEDVNGNQFEGRFLRELFGKLTIEADDGKQTVFELEDLSEVDQKYLRVMVPPEMIVDLRTKNVRIPQRPQTLEQLERVDEYWATAVITKKTQRPFTSRLKAEFFLIAEEVEGSNYILLNRTEMEFLLPVISKGAQVELESHRARTILFEDVMSGEVKGENFAGCLFVISTLQGDIVLTDSGLASWIEKPEVIENLRELFIRGAPSVRSRHFDKTGKKVPPPRPPHSGPSTQ